MPARITKFTQSPKSLTNTKFGGETLEFMDGSGFDDMDGNVLDDMTPVTGVRHSPRVVKYEPRTKATKFT